MKVCKTGKRWLNMDNFIDAVDRGDNIAIVFANDGELTFEGAEAQMLRDWLNEAHVKTEL